MLIHAMDGMDQRFLSGAALTALALCGRLPAPATQRVEARSRSRAVILVNAQGNAQGNAHRGIPTGEASGPGDVWVGSEGRRRRQAKKKPLSAAPKGSPLRGRPAASGPTRPYGGGVGVHAKGRTGGKRLPGQVPRRVLQGHFNAFASQIPNRIFEKYCLDSLASS